nr:hypothetical protein CFP56_59725 [Quercus suber]
MSKARILIDLGAAGNDEEFYSHNKFKRERSPIWITVIHKDNNTKSLALLLTKGKMLLLCLFPAGIFTTLL